MRSSYPLHGVRVMHLTAILLLQIGRHDPGPLRGGGGSDAEVAGRLLTRDDPKARIHPSSLTSAGLAGAGGGPKGESLAGASTTHTEWVAYDEKVRSRGGAAWPAACVHCRVCTRQRSRPPPPPAPLQVKGDHAVVLLRSVTVVHPLAVLLLCGNAGAVGGGGRGAAPAAGRSAYDGANMAALIRLQCGGGAAAPQATQVDLGTLARALLRQVCVRACVPERACDG